MASESDPTEQKITPAEAQPAEPSPPAKSSESSSRTARPRTGGPFKNVDKPARKWTPPAVPPQTTLSNTTLTIALVAFAVLMVGGFLFLQMSAPGMQPAGPPPLGPEFCDTEDNFCISRPLNWKLEDRVKGTSIIIKGFKEKGYPPLIMVSLDIAPGRLISYVNEHKARTSHQDKSVVWLSEERDQGIDGCDAMRLEYDCEIETDGHPVKVRTLQYILEDRPRFYRITCSVAADVYDSYLARFEASARSFRRVPMPPEPPKVLPK